MQSTFNNFSSLSLRHSCMLCAGGDEAGTSCCSCDEKVSDNTLWHHFHGVCKSPLFPVQLQSPEGWGSRVLQLPNFPCIEHSRHASHVGSGRKQVPKCSHIQNMWLKTKHSFLVLLVVLKWERGGKWERGSFFSMRSPEAIDLDDVSSHLWQRLLTVYQNLYSLPALN